MKTAEFIAKFGFNVAEKCLKNCFSPNDKWFIHEGELVSNNEFDLLKTYVDAWELVQNFGGLNKALEMINNPICFGDANFEVEAQLRKAITLVEEVESLKEVC